MGRRVTLIAWVTCHLALIASVCSRDTASLIRSGLTWIPAGHQKAGTEISPRSLAPRDSLTNVLRSVVAAYLRSTGIEASYSFFAPNVPDSYALVFELHFPDGRVTYEPATASTGEGTLRVAGLMDEISLAKTDEVRTVMLRLLAQAVWREHHHATRIRAIFVRVVTPTLVEWSAGKNGVFEPMYLCELARPARDAETPKP